MTAWVGWVLLGGVLVLAELFTGTFHLLMVALGMAAGAIAASLGISMEWQFVVAGMVAAAGTAVLRRSRFGKRDKVSAARDRNVNLDIGQAIDIDHWHRAGADSAFYTARVKYRGALWDVELAPGETAHSGQFMIQEIRGSRLIVASRSNN